MPTPLIAALWAFALFTCTAIWVPVEMSLIAQSSHAYYSADVFHAVQLRSLMGGIAHLLGLSPGGFVWMMQAFRLGWLMVLCQLVFQAVPRMSIAALICALFAATDIMYLPNAMGGFVDSAADFWLMLAAACVLHRGQQKQRIYMAAALVALCLAVLTHEKTVFGCAVILTWAMMQYGKCGVWLAVAWAILMGVYFAVAWNHVIYGGPPDYYARYGWDSLRPLLRRGDVSLITSNLFYVFSAAGMLWGVYAWLGLQAVLGVQGRTPRLRVGAFIAVGWLASIVPFFMGGDVQRMVEGIWLPLLLLMIEQARSGHRWARKPSFVLLWTVLLALQMLVPPLFTMGPSTRPLNDYARVCLHYLRQGVW